MGRFFQESQGFKYEAVIDLFLHRYNGSDYLLSMPYKDCAVMLRYGQDQERESRIFAQWVMHLPHMSFKEIQYISFEEYRDKVTGKNIDLRSNEDIIREIEQLHGIKIEV